MDENDFWDFDEVLELEYVHYHEFVLMILLRKVSIIPHLTQVGLTKN